ncbi:MAG TPA: RES family NAD+ phosphorylase [Longimicrobium sp.]|nr:RES family NAD+ phosphorylase [Longimicrobium sp.]
MAIPLPRRPPVTTLPAGATLWRVHRNMHDALWFGPAAGSPARGRFDAPTGQFGICYFGMSLPVAVLETLVRGSRDRLIDRADLEARTASLFTTREPLRLLQFEGAGLVRLGIGAEQAHAADYGDTQRLALDLYERDPKIQGVQYRSRWDNSLSCVALFDRAATTLGDPAAHWLADPTVIGRTLVRYELELV